MIIKTHKDEIAPYLIDASNFSAGCADMVVIPNSINELVEFMLDNNNLISVAGAGTGVSAGRIPSCGAIVSVEKFDSIEKLENGKIKLGAGVRLSDLNKALEGTEWFYPPNPTENQAFIGGTIATNASGPRSYKFGTTREYVLELELVLGDGRLVKIKRGRSIDSPLICSDGSSINFPTVEYVSPPFKNAAGYFIQPGMDWVDLFTGSDGTLAIITGVILDLRPRPKRFFSAILFFLKEEMCWKMVGSIKSMKSRRIDPCSLEYFDAKCLFRLKNKYPNIPKNAKSALCIEQDISNENDFEPVLETWYDFLEGQDVLMEDSWFANTPRDMKIFREFRHAVPLIVNEENFRLGRVKMGTDFAIKDGKLFEMMNFYKDVLSETKIDYVVFGHVGDNHLHINLLPDKEEIGRAKEVYNRLVNQILNWDGTVSAEHGIGKLKKKWFHQMTGEKSLEEMRSIKRTLDPGGKLGIGNLF